MSNNEYRIVPAPDASVRIKGVGRKDDPFARTVEEILNQQAREGWTYLRTDTVTERRGRWPLRNRRIERDLLVFSRDRAYLMPSMQQTDEIVQVRRVRPTQTVPFVRAAAEPAQVAAE